MNHMMMNRQASIILREAEEGLRNQHDDDYSQCSTSSSSPLDHPRRSANKPKSNILVRYFENAFVAVALALFFVFVTVITLFIQFIVACNTLIHRLRQPRPTTRINTNDDISLEDEEETFHFPSAAGFRLSQGDLNNLSSFKYANVKATQDCSVCLQSLKQGESCRSLSKCKHIFHANCIDSWLIRVPSCPVCREIVAKPEVNQLEVVGGSYGKA